MTKTAGYSLVEVLIAFVIMSMILAALIPGQARLLGRAVLQEERILAHDYALSRLAKFGVLEDLLPGITQDNYRNWQISTTVVPGKAVTMRVETVHITVTISNAQGREIARVEKTQIIR